MRTHIKKISLLFVMFLSVFVLFAQEETEDEGEWYWDKPISEITFEGLKNVKKSELNGIVSSYIGEPFDEETYNDLLDRFYALDLFEDIEPYAKHGKKEDDVLLVFQVTEKPIINSISFQGNKQIRNGELRDKINSKASDVFVESKILMDERILREYYISKGYTDSQVSHTVEEVNGEVKITFVINEGSHVVISKITMHGNTIASERTLKSKLKLKEVGFLKNGAYQKSTLEADKQTLLAYYQERGYIDASFVDVVLTTSRNEEKNRDELTIDFIIQEGSQYIFSGIDFQGNEVFSTEQLSSYLKMKKGDIFNYTKFYEAMSGIQGLYLENGYMSLELAPIPNKNVDRHEVSYMVNIVEHRRSHIENVIIKGNSKTKERVIRREIPIESGDVFSRDKIVNGLRNLYNLQYFSNVVPEYEPGSEENLVDLIFSVEEQATTTFQFGLTFSGAGLAVSENSIAMPFSLFLKMENSNLFGEGRSIAASTTLSTSEQSIELSYSQSWIGNLPISFSQSLSFSHSSATGLRLDFTPDGLIDGDYHYLNYVGWSASLGTAVGKRWAFDYAIISAAGGISNSLTRYDYDEGLFIPISSGLPLFANRWGLLNSLWGSVSIDNRDINYDPSKGWFFSERLGWYGLIPGLESEFFLRSDSKLEGYVTLLNIPFTEKWSLKAVLAGYTGLSGVFQVSDFFSDSNKLYLDGMFNARGWTGLYNKTKGKAMLSNRLEIRVPIAPGYIGIDGFFDAAAVKEDMGALFTSLSIDDFYFSFGPGIRFLIPQFPIHLMFAWKFKTVNGKAYWSGDLPNFRENTFQFVLSFNLTNR